MCRAIGNQGNWFARIEAKRHPEIDGKNLPCVWDFFLKGGNRYDSDFDLSGKKFQELGQALVELQFAVLRRRDMTLGSDEWRSAGYIAVFEIANVVVGERLTFDVVRRVCDLNR